MLLREHFRYCPHCRQDGNANVTRLVQFRFRWFQIDTNESLIVDGVMFEMQFHYEFQRLLSRGHQPQIRSFDQTDSHMSFRTRRCSKV